VDWQDWVGKIAKKDSWLKDYEKRPTKDRQHRHALEQPAPSARPRRAGHELNTTQETAKWD